MSPEVKAVLGKCLQKQRVRWARKWMSISQSCSKSTKLESYSFCNMAVTVKEREKEESRK